MTRTFPTTECAFFEDIETSVEVVLYPEFYEVGDEGGYFMGVYVESGLGCVGFGARIFGRECQ